MTQADLGGGDWPPPALSSPLMAVLPPVSRPSVALRDLVAFLRQRSREQVIAAILAVLVTIIIVIIFLVDSKINTAPPPQIVYVESWPADRPDDVIKKQNAIDHKKRDAILLERRRGYQRLAKSLGIDY